MLLKRIIAGCMVIYMLLLTACWDKTEIDDRAFVLGLAVDELKAGGSGGGSDGASGKLQAKGKDIQAIFYMPIPSKLVGGQVDAFSTEVGKGVNITDAVDDLRLKFNRDIFLGQLKIILISEKLLQDPVNFKKLLDFVERDPDMGRGALIGVVKGGIDELKQIKPKFEKVFAAYMKGVFDNASSISGLLKVSTNEFLGNIRENKGRSILPVVRVEKDHAVCDDIALIKDYKLYRYLDKKYLRPFSILTGKQKDGDIQIPYFNDFVSLKVTSSESNISLIDQGTVPRYKLDVKMEADIDNYSFNQDLFDNEQVKAIRNKGSAQMKKEIENMIAYFQKDMAEDYLSVGDYTKKYHNGYYQKVQQRWDNTFSKAAFNVQVQLLIRRIGGTRK